MSDRGHTSEARQTFEEFVEPEFDAAAPPVAKPFTVWSPARFMEWSEPPDLDILGGGFLRKSGLMVIAGQGGVGKSRLALQMAICQILGIPFVGIDTRGGPGRWLFIGNENSIARTKGDLAAMLSQFDATQLAALEGGLSIQALLEMEDFFIGIGDDDIKSRWAATLAAVKPTVLVADPFGNILAGDLLKDADVRFTIAEITRLARRVNPEMAIILLHHARTGRQNIVQAVGWDRGNFLLGSKALYSAARTVINLAPGDREDGGVIVMSCGKCNDAKPFSTAGLRLDEATRFYSVDDSFDVEAWEADVSGERSGSDKSLTVQDVIDFLAARGGSCPKTELKSALREEYECSRQTVDRRLKDGFSIGYIRADSKGVVRLTTKAKPRKSTTPEGEDEPF